METERTLSGVLRLMHQQAEPLLPPSAVPEDHVDSRQLEQRLLAGSPADGAAGAAAERTSSAGAAAASGAGEYLLFGDSFVRLFGLVKHADIKIHAYKGATARGLSKEKNEHRVHIAKQLATRAAAGKEARAAVFVFGNVDVHFSYYYTRYAKKKQIDFEGIARDYVDFVAGLPAASRVIVGAYPSSITEDAQAVASLIPYSILTKEQAAKVDAADATLRARQGRVRTFNRLLAARCAEKGVSYHDTFDEMTVEEKDGRGCAPSTSTSPTSTSTWCGRRRSCSGSSGCRGSRSARRPTLPSASPSRSPSTCCRSAPSSRGRTSPREQQERLLAVDRRVGGARTVGETQSEYCAALSARYAAAALERPPRGRPRGFAGRAQDPVGARSSVTEVDAGVHQVRASRRGISPRRAVASGQAGGAQVSRRSRAGMSEPPTPPAYEGGTSMCRRVRRVVFAWQ